MELRERALLSQGAGLEAVYRMVAAALRERGVRGRLVDMGCGQGRLWGFVGGCFSCYVGVDAVRYEEFPPGMEFIEADFDGAKVPLADGCADAVAAVETIEHLENPRAFMRELVRLAKPGGWIAVTTPNNLSALSLLTLAVKHRFQQFQDANYPAHITALLESDLLRIARECGLSGVAVEYSNRGRVALTPWHYPRWLSGIFPRALSDNLLLIGRKT